VTVSAGRQGVGSYYNSSLLYMDVYTVKRVPVIAVER